ncbi:trans-sialidase, partial [Trypanosoma conorhini]
MPRRLFSSALPLLLFFICCGSESVQADGPVAATAIDPFAGTTLVSGAKWEEIKPTEGSVCSLRDPSLVEVGGEVFAVAAAQCRKEGAGDGGGFAGIASKHLKKSEDYSLEVSAADASSFGAQLLKKGAEATDVMQPTTVVHGRNVYMLLGNYSRASSASQVSGKTGWNLLLVKGTVTGDGEAMKIQWSETHAVQPEAHASLNSLTRLAGGGGSGLVLSDGTLVFPMQATDKTAGTSVLLVMRFTASEKKWTLSYDTTGASCSDPSVVEWEKNKSSRWLPVRAATMRCTRPLGERETGLMWESRFPACGA